MFKAIRWAFRQGQRITAKELIAEVQAYMPPAMLYPSLLKNDASEVEKELFKDALIDYSAHTQLRNNLKDFQQFIRKTYLDEKDL